MTIPLPPAHAVARLLEDLIGRPVRAATCATSPFDRTQRAVGAYIDDAQVLRAVAVCDFQAGGSLGAALVVMPPACVDECIRDRALDGMLVENLYEVFNVLSAVFPAHGAPRLILRELVQDGALPPDIATLLDRPVRRLDLALDVTGYRRGKLSILAG